MPIDKILASDESFGTDGIVKTLRQKIQVSCPAGRNPVDEPGVPRRGAVSALDPDLRFDSIAGTEWITRDSGVDTYQVSLLYSSDGRYRFKEKERDRKEPGFKEFSETFSKEDQKIPMFRRKTEISKKLIGVAEIEIESYKWLPDPLERRINIRTITVLKLQEGYDLVMSALIASRIDQIHTIGGALFRMLPPSVEQVDATMFEITYKWASDPGTPSYASLNSATRIAPGARPPFNRYVIIPSETIDGPPIVDVEAAFSQEQLVPDGYLGLPGNPIVT